MPGDRNGKTTFIDFLFANKQAVLQSDFPMQQNIRKSGAAGVSGPEVEEKGSVG